MPQDSAARPTGPPPGPPQVTLLGEVNDAMCATLIDALAAPAGEGDVVIALTTLGGDADMARRMVLEIDLARERLGRRLVFLGRTVVYSAGTTIMSAFPVQDRYLSADARLMVHCRQLDQSLHLSGPLRTSVPRLEALLRQLQVGIELEEESFVRLVEGSDIGMDELRGKALHNWYLTATEAVGRGLVAAIA